MSVRDVAVHYFACITAHDADGLASLFAEDAWLRPPPPVKVQVHGRDAIRDYYAQLFERAPDLKVVDYRLIADGDVCAAPHTSFIRGEAHNSTVDIFTVNERGELMEMIAYRR